MKIIKRCFLIFLAFSLAFGAVACGNNGGGNENNNDETNIEETDTYFIRNGMSDYKVVLPENPQGYEADAADELVNFVNEASGIVLPKVFENEITVAAESKLLLVGETEAAKTAGIKADPNVYGPRGFVLKQVDTNVYMIGGGTQGSVFAAYEFLKGEFGFEVYATDEIAIEHGVTEKKLMKFNIGKIPDIRTVQGTGLYWSTSAQDSHRMSYTGMWETFVHATGQPWHNTLEWVPASEKDAHPKWFTGDGKPTGSSSQLDYTCRGDDAEREALLEYVYDRMTEKIDEEFAAGRICGQIGFMHEDNNGHWAESAEYTEKYGTAAPAAILIHFINDLQTRITAYMDEKYDGRKMSITFFAYVDSQTPPTKNVNGKYTPIDDTVVLHKDANVLVAPIYSSWVQDADNNGMAALIDGWAALASNMSFWFYDYYFATNTLMYMDSTYSLQSYFRKAKEVNATYLFNETCLGNDIYYAFGRLKEYLMSKLGWNVDIDVDKAIDDFFKNYYKDAYEPMKAYFDEVITWFAYLKDNYAISGVGGSGGINRNTYFNEGATQGWMKHINDAYKAIEPLKTTDGKLYAKIYNRILYDSIMPRYILLKHFAKEAFDDASFVAEVAQWKADCASLGIVTAGGHADAPKIADFPFAR